MAEFGPKFTRLTELLARDPTGLELRADATALAPERLLVFEVRGSISTFVNALRNVPGLELIDEEELEADESDTAPVAYLLVPDARAMRELVSLWTRWQRNDLARGESPWRDVFNLLRDLRPWGPADRISPTESDILEELIGGRLDNDRIKLEVELVFRASEEIADEREAELNRGLARFDANIVFRSRIRDIAYHALLIDLPVASVRQIIRRSPDGIGGLDAIMHIRPQSIASTIEVVEGIESEQRPTAAILGEPILALLDGVPVSAHPALADHLVVDDQFGLEGDTPVADRVHGTAMSSLIVHGDRNLIQSALRRRIHVVPVLGAGDAFQSDRLIVDVIYSAIRAMRDGANATAPNVLIVNLSLGNPRRPFHGQMSPWARVLDRLAYKYGLLFIVSAGNCVSAFSIAAFATHEEFEDAPIDRKAAETLRAVGAIVAERRMFSPAETVNGLTIGACNQDAVAPGDRAVARVNVDPYGDLPMANPSSALGPGFALSVKPDVLMPGARERLLFVRSDPRLEVRPAAPARSAGLRVAAPPQGGLENREGFTSGTSAAAALASRTAHRIHDGLEDAYGDEFLRLSAIQRAVLLKALLAHPARWPENTASLIRQTIGPADGRLHVRQKDNIRRFLGYGIVDPEDAVACAADRATFWATGLLRRDRIAEILVPIPAAITGQALPHSLFATLAWFTPILPGRKTYRSIRLRLVEPTELEQLAVQPHSNQPDMNQINRGTLLTRSWSGHRAPALPENATIRLIVQREPDQTATIDEAVPYGLAITLTMPGVETIYAQIQQRLGIAPRAQIR